MPYASLGLAALVLLVATRKAFDGNIHARDFLWTWAIALGVLWPFGTTLGQHLTPMAIALAAVAAAPCLLHTFNPGRQALEKAEADLRRVLAESARRTDEERRRIARRLHDGVNPCIVLARLHLQHVADIADRAIGDPETRQNARRIIESGLQAMANAYNDIRDVIKETRTELIDSVGLIPALQSLVQHYQSAVDRPDFVFQNRIGQFPELPDWMASNVYRMVQEALLNVVKHADAKQVRLSIERRNDGYRVEIADDGKGMPGNITNGFGLIDLRERARSIGGSLEIIGSMPRGTSVSFSFAAPNPSNRT